MENVGKEAVAFFKEYYLSALPAVRESLSSFPKKIDEKWSRMSVSREMPAGYLEGISRVLVPPMSSCLSREGKLLRSVLSCLVLEAGGRKREDFLPLLAMMEIMESSTLLMDDILDRSPSRRGIASAHLLFGPGQTLLSSGLFYYSAWNLFSAGNMPVSRSAEEKAFNWLAGEQLAGSFAQMKEVFDRRREKLPDREQYLAAVASKISILSFSGPLYLAGLAADFPEEKLKIMEKLGKTAGLAYHLHGDELNLFPRSGTWGKKRGDDIISGTTTYLFSEAVRASNADERAFLLESLGRQDLTAAEMERALRIVEKSGALAKNREAIDLLRLESSGLAESLSWPEKHEKILKGFIDYVAYERKK